MSLDDEKTLYVIVVGENTEPDDAGVQGVYEIGVAGQLYEGQQYEAALDQFHDHVGIGMLDDFTINVLDAHGHVLQGLEDYENGEFSELAVFYGSFDIGQAPPAVSAAFRQSAAKNVRLP
ncbi:hypothetical protein G6L37_03285 [Agrobacterium rubi]|nr:hypothetical protein [Agrobacterium rubi]NTF24399.1 hypothetical protein [Agrobacterium rubi]